jgi:hypothetical protein
VRDECLDAVEDPFKAEGELVVGWVGVVEDARVEDRMHRGKAAGVGKPPQRVAQAVPLPTPASMVRDRGGHGGR